MNTAVYFIHAITPLHAGIGQGAGDIDLPIARERPTRMPYLPGSSLKGALRALCDKEAAVPLFGPDTANASEHAGSVQLSDARLLFFPVRSLYGIFAYVTSPFLIRRFLRDVRDVACTAVAFPDAGEPEANECFVTDNTVLRDRNNRVWLEDLGLTSLPRLPRNDFEAIATAVSIPELAQRVCVVSDDVLTFFVETATEVTARIRLDGERLTVEKGGLWYEEALPTETILTGLVQTRTLRKDGKTFIAAEDALTNLRTILGKRNVVQLGGKATVGRGVCRLSLTEGAR